MSVLPLDEFIKKLKTETENLIDEANDLSALEEIRIKFVGRKGLITQTLRQLRDVPTDQRPALGKLANEANLAVQDKLEAKIKRMQKGLQEDKLKTESIDITFPGRSFYFGRLHPLTLTVNRINEIFIGMGFTVREAPEVETDYYNFEALNMPAHHPARDMWDSFYLKEDLLLRTHSSPVQIHSMEKQQPPIRVIGSGRCYRRDALDSSHHWMFNQMEGFMVDENVTLGDLKGVLSAFAEQFFYSNIKTRFRPSYFPFTEPSAEVDVSCVICGGSGCSVCGRTGWLEILGAGMIHPQVLRGVGYDDEKYSGFAFGAGIERLTMLKYGIDDIRLFAESDLRFLKQF